jgi:hypothetical protein
MQMTAMSHKWPFIVLAVGYILLSLIHLGAALMLLFVYGGKGSLSSQPDLLPLYSQLGTLGYAVFFATIPLDLIAALYLLRSRFRGRTVTFAAAVLNLPLIPLGTLVGVCTLGLLLFVNREFPPASGLSRPHNSPRRK